MDEYFKKRLWVNSPRAGGVFAIGVELLIFLLFYWGMLFCLFAFNSIEFKRNTFITMGLAGAVMSFFFAYAQMVLFCSYLAFVRQVAPKLHAPLQYLWAIIILKLAPLALLSVFLPLAIRRKKWMLSLIIILIAISFILPLFSLAYLAWGFVSLTLYGALMIYVFIKQRGEKKISGKALLPGALVLLLVGALIFSVGVLKTINAYCAYDIAMEFKLPQLNRRDFLSAYYQGNNPNDDGFDELDAKAQVLSQFFRNFERTGLYPATPKDMQTFEQFCADNANSLRLLDLYASRPRHETLEYDIILFTRPRARSLAQSAGFNYYLHLMYFAAKTNNQAAFDTAEQHAMNLLANSELLPKRNESMLYLSRLQRLGALYLLLAPDGFLSVLELQKREINLTKIAHAIPYRLLLSLSCDYQGVEWCCNYFYVEAPQVAMQAFLQTEIELPFNFYSIQFWGELDKFYLLKQFKNALSDSHAWIDDPASLPSTPRLDIPNFARVTHMVAPRTDSLKQFALQRANLFELSRQISLIRNQQQTTK